ncbi:MAG: sulfotransferase domain-containing protein [candidate division KSB1 bacterium]|nr:sulfotransferase domain-containing protein [candidate division KSB1 bacterium]MDZ7275681.1 sulfotransferase domain-containing protein [candidate division KSB1 bacterium]MDZ7284628.1 sulfotransferase domain-containing protein [candidate division KSB1 bacterium]MDZ7297953.1 sulfotransferase domain-containing protein [candidate division KSB1 bacterium]MDZ7308318.1 sulfotransferase domain-containing protein [candidate division KSB1 bacterium]
MMASFGLRPVAFLKEEAKRFLLTRAGLKRVHIVGCARSGTTMLHYAMIAFANTILFDRETAPWSAPGLKLSFILWREAAGGHNPGFFITKRYANWWRPAQVSRLADYARRYQVFIINLIRDPRDVLTSRHALDPQKYYVTPELWENSIAAGRQLEHELRNSPCFLTIKYEDVILQSQRVEQLLHHKLGLCLRRHLKSWSRLKENLQASNVSARMLPYMHRLRDFDPSSIQKWRHDPHKAAYINQLLTASPHAEKLQAFLTENEYVDAGERPPLAKRQPRLETV